MWDGAGLHEDYWCFSDVLVWIVWNWIVSHVKMTEDKSSYPNADFSSKCDLRMLILQANIIRGRTLTSNLRSGFQGQIHRLKADQSIFTACSQKPFHRIGLSENHSGESSFSVPNLFCPVMWTWCQCVIMLQAKPDTDKQTLKIWQSDEVTKLS